MAISFKGAHFPPDIILMGVRWYKARQNILYTSAEISRLYSALRCNFPAGVAVLLTLSVA